MEVRWGRGMGEWFGVQVGEQGAWGHDREGLHMLRGDEGDKPQLSFMINSRFNVGY